MMIVGVSDIRPVVDLNWVEYPIVEVIIVEEDCLMIKVGTSAVDCLGVNVLVKSLKF